MRRRRIRPLSFAEAPRRPAEAERRRLRRTFLFFAACMTVRILRFLWTLPNTVLGLLFVPLALATGGAVRRVDEVLEVHGGAVAWLLRHAVPLPGGVAALTIGHVVLGRDGRALDVFRRHERVHVRQYGTWGPIFIPLYLFSSLIVWLRGGDAYRDNPFEREAFRER